MSMQPEDLGSEPGIALNGLDGGNPLGFLAAVGTVVTAARIWPEMRIAWEFLDGGWRPSLTGCGDDQKTFIKALHTALAGVAMTPFDISDKMPFEADGFAYELQHAARLATPNQRRVCDFFAAFGTEAYPDKNGIFQDSRFRMVRSGDSKGQGLPVYAKAIRGSVEAEHLQRTLFQPWDYQDESFNLRWDPIDDQRYALRWRDPSKSGISDGPGTMLGANALAIEALPFFPTFITQGSRARTTGFYRTQERQTYFAWPIWKKPLDINVMKSILAMSALIKEQLPRTRLRAMGIVEVYRSQRIQQNQYYSNFTPAQPA